MPRWAHSRFASSLEGVRQRERSRPRRPRIAARGDGELALVFTDAHGRPRLAHRPPGVAIVASELVVPADLSITGYNQTEEEPPIGEDDRTGLLENVAHLASADGLFGGIPMDVAFSPTYTRPVVSWVATRPNGLDYHALVARCTATSGDTELSPAPFLRPLFDHYVLRALSAVIGPVFGGITAPAQQLAGVFSFQVGSVSIEEEISEVRVQWRAHGDGGLGLQGYYEVTLRLADPPIRLEFLDSTVVDTSPTRLVIRLQPYFRPRPTGLDPCDLCSQRRMDATLGFALVSANLVRDEEGSSAPPDVAGCGCEACDATASCLLNECVPDGTLSIDDVNDLPIEIRQQVETRLAAALPALERLLYSITSDPVVGGLVLGRELSIAQLRDTGICGVSRVPLDSTGAAIAIDPACGTVQQRLTAPTRVADTIELLRVGDGRAALVGRDNP